jgi:hypothetical protein
MLLVHTSPVHTQSNDDVYEHRVWYEPVSYLLPYEEMRGAKNKLFAFLSVRFDDENLWKIRIITLSTVCTSE